MERMTRQVRCWASLASLVLAFLVFQQTSVQRWQSFTVHLMGASSPAGHGLAGWQERPMKPQISPELGTGT
jgi:hypothetical protein